MELDDTKSSIIKSKELDFRRISFAKPYKTPEKLYVCQATLDQTNGSAVFIQTPYMTVRQSFAGQQNSKKNIYLDLQITDDSFYQLLRYIDTHIIEHVFKNRESWFSKENTLSMAAVEDCYKTPISKQAGQPWPTVRMKLNTIDSTNHTTYFVNKKETDIDELKDNSSVMAIVQLRGLLMNKGSIQPEWVIHMLKSVREPERKPKFAELIDQLPTNEKDTL